VQNRVMSVAVFICFLFVSALLPADQLVLENGDRLSGTIIKSDDTSLLIKTAFAGQVTVEWPAIEQISSSQPLHLGLKDGQTVVGTVTTANGGFAVQAPGQPAIEVPRAAVVFIRSDSEQAAYDKSLHMGWMQGWAGGANVSFALTRGNSQTKNLALAFTADRKTAGDHLGLYANSVFAGNDAPGAATTAQATQSGARYDRNFDSRLFSFGSADFQTDALQSLDLRSVLGAGLGLHAIRGDRTTLDILAGGNYTRENYSSLQRDVAAVTLGEELMKKLGAATVLMQKLYAYPALSDGGQYRAVFNFGTLTKLNRWFGWQNAFSDIYVTNPPAGKRQNDILLTTGLNISFSH
jgi:putative salt-induced outer membrane protein YdiY